MKKTHRVTLALIIAASLFLSSLPYLAGILMQPKGVTFTGFTYNIDDACVYSSWLKQVASGHLLYQNNYSNAPQHGRQFNLLFLLMGIASRITHLSPAAVFHLFRLLLGAGLLLIAWKFSEAFFSDDRKRLFFVAILALSSGFGWLFPANGHQSPVDMWQPEAITFLSLYLNPLFLAGQLLMLSSLYFLLRARITGKLQPALLAGLSLLLLANVHSYDIITVACVWAGYLLISCILEKRLLIRPILLSILAALVAIPAIGYQIYLYRLDDLFRLRANTPAPSPAIWSYFLGFGAILIAAVFGVREATKNKKNLLIVCWAIIGFVLPYLPYAQQRKFIMGLHIPLAILAVTGLWPLIKKMTWSNARALGLTFIVLTGVGNLFFLQRDIKMLEQNNTAPIYRPFLLNSEINSMKWLGIHSKPNDSVFAPRDLALFIPALSGNQVYYGHWSETPNYAVKLREWMTFVDTNTPDALRKEILKRSGADYVAFNAIPGAETVDLSRLSYLQIIHRNGPTSIYRVKTADL